MAIEELELAAPQGRVAEMVVQFEVERFYYREANLLDDREFE
ncbi:MAG: hypothetical protein QOC92_2812, partial [Acidimicrobiaceae bacterium]